MQDIFSKGIKYDLLDFPTGNKENEKEGERLHKSRKTPMYKGNPQIVATNGESIVLQRGNLHYALISIGDSIKDIHKWYNKDLLTSTLEKEGYFMLESPEPYEEPKDEDMD